jgi:2-C-methyl-D-erythritol 2,4-cyclodiphosphate synthase
MRVGFGYDVHRFASGKPLVLGGVNIPWYRGLAGHSDADVVLHAIMDALLGAASLGDIGQHFPDTDPAWSGAKSTVLLTKVVDLLQAHSYHVINVDVTLVLEEPRVAPYIEPMRKVIADLLHVSIGAVSVKATTSEKMGFIGAGEGAVAYAIAMIDAP